MASNLDKKLAELEALRKRVGKLEQEIQTLAKQRQAEARSVLETCAKLLGEDPKDPFLTVMGKSKRPDVGLAELAARAPAGGKTGAASRILAWLETHQGDSRAIAAGIGAGTDPAAIKRVDVRLYYLRARDKVVKADGVWALAEAKPGATKRNGKLAAQHAEALAWADAHPDDPKAAKIREIAERHT